MSEGSVALRVMGILLILIFVLLLPPALVLRNMGEIVFSRDQLRKLVDKAVLNPALPVWVIHQGAFSDVIAQEASLMQMSSSDADEVVRIVEGMIPRDLLDSTLDEILKSAGIWLNRGDGWSSWEVVQWLYPGAWRRGALGRHLRIDNRTT